MLNSTWLNSRQSNHRHW